MGRHAYNGLTNSRARRSNSKIIWRTSRAITLERLLALLGEYTPAVVLECERNERSEHSERRQHAVQGDAS